MVDLRQIKAYIKFKLVIVGFDMGAEFVKRFVMLFFFEVGQFMDNNHS